MRDPFYGSSEWRELRAACLKRDGYRCTWLIDGLRCRNRATRADHMKPRRDGGADALANLRSLCSSCDALRHAEKGFR